MKPSPNSLIDASVVSERTGKYVFHLPSIRNFGSRIPTKSGRKTLRIAALYFTVSAALILSTLLIEKGDAVLWLNAMYNPFTNAFFKYFTHLGDGLVFIPLILFFFFVNKKFALYTAATGVMLAVLVNFFKRAIFLGAPRPKKFFEGAEVLQYVEGVSIHSMHAFPSGHTATAAAVALIIALHYKDKKITWIALAIALLIGISRMYLALHFLQDVAFGFLLGTATASGLYFAFYSQKIWKRKRSKSPALAEHDAGLAFE